MFSPLLCNLSTDSTVVRIEVFPSLVKVETQDSRMIDRKVVKYYKRGGSKKGEAEGGKPFLRNLRGGDRGDEKQK